MRSRTDPNLAGRCHRCWLATRHCVCGAITSLANRTEIVIVRHHHESWRASGTARIAELALERCRVVEAGPDFDQADAALADLGAAWLLFPDGDTAEYLGPPPPRLVVLDGTWREVRRMQRRLPALWPLKRLRLAPKEAAPLRLRRGVRAEYRSTLESIADAFVELGEPTTAAALSALHDCFVERSLKARGTWAQRRAERATD